MLGMLNLTVRSDLWIGITKTKGAFPNENSLLKLLYMGIQNAKKNGLCRLETGTLHFLSWQFSLKEDWMRL